MPLNAGLGYTPRAFDSRRNRIFSRLIRFLLIAILVIFGGCVLAGWYLVRRTLPRLDGAIALPDLKREVAVERDRYGVPWIRAASVDDLLVAQGYVMAQDRLWQMDLIRRVAAGELSEIFGPVALSIDRDNRTLGLRQAAERNAAAMDPETRALVEAYAKGVNRYIEQQRGRLSLEFQLLRYQPRPWTPADTVLVSGYMYKVLTSTWKAELARADVTARVGPERARDLFVTDSPLDHFLVGEVPPGRKPGAVSASLPPPPREELPSLGTSGAGTAVWLEAQGFLGQFDEQVRAVLGSNNFVVSGAHTHSGKPLLANDTHLPLDVPDIWYIIHLTAPGWNVKGFALPGVPFVIIGHNNRIAWGFTNNMADVQDLYVETFNPQNPREYRVNSNWAAAELRKETIHIRGRRDETLEVVLTRHGPIVLSEGNRGFALRWTATDPGGMDFGFPLVGRAQNWDDFRKAMRRIPGPAQNAVYADVDGNIGYFVAALIPVRKNGDGQVPVPGDTDEYEWSGYIPFDELPQALNPPGGIIATANARVAGPGYHYYLTDRWAAPFRTERIYELLEGRNDLRPADCAAIQTDSLSLPDRFFAAQLVRASQTAQSNDPQVRDLVNKLAGWDARAVAGSVETSFLALVRRELLDNLLRPYLADDTHRFIWWRDVIFLENVLRDRPARWLPKEYASYDALLMASADQAVARLRKLYGRSEDSWRWGRVDSLRLDHPLGRSGFLRPFFSVGPAEHDGSFDTIDAIGPAYGPAMRFVADLADFDNSLMEITLGESGQYGSAYFRDQFPSWLNGRGLPAPFSEAAEEKAHVHRLLLEPVAAAPSH